MYWMLRRELAQQLGFDDRWRNAVDQHTARGELFAERLRQPDHPCFGGRVGAHVRVALFTCDRRDIDDPTDAARLHVRQDGFAAVEGPVQVDCEHPPPIVVGILGQGRRWSRDAGIVHQHVDPTKACERGVDHRPSTGGLGTSISQASAMPPWATIRSTCPAAAVASRSATQTARPSAPSRSAIAAPMPRAAPVTMATRSVTTPTRSLDRVNRAHSRKGHLDGADRRKSARNVSPVWAKTDAHIAPGRTT